MRFVTATTALSALFLATVSTVSAAGDYWLEKIPKQGISAFHSSPSSYQVFRNVKSFGAKGDGVTDDTAAIQLAITYQNRCAPGVCESSTTTPAVVYFPAGTYLISSSIIDYYYTQIIGNPNDLAVIKATPNFQGFGLIDGNQYQAGGILGFGPTNLFFRQIRNIVFDLTSIPAGTEATGVHWPTAQATSLQNCVFKMSTAGGTKHQGMFIEGGSGGFMTDLTFYGGKFGVVFGNQQFTTRNLVFYNCVTAISQLWDWGWTYQGLSINNCTTGIDMSGGGRTAQTVGSVTVLDSSFTNVYIAVATAHDQSSKPDTAGSLVLENVVLTNVANAVTGPYGPVLAGGSRTIPAWGQGHKYTPTGPDFHRADLIPFVRPGALMNGARYYVRAKPQYAYMPLSNFVSARAAGARGDGYTDDTAALNALFASAAANGKVVFVDAGTYRVTSTLYVPPGSKIVGESYSVILAAGSFFASATSPRPVVQVGNAGQTGIVEISDMIVSTQGATAGAILIQWNLAAPVNSPGGLWDVHTRIGGFAGSNLQLAQCAKTPTAGGAVNRNCAAAFASMHVAPSAAGVYLENVWLWVADHDIEDAAVRQITVYAGRGLHVESANGPVWLIGTSVEHHDLYQYQFARTRNIYAGQIQTETAYWQPSPRAGVATPVVAGWNDPNFAALCPAATPAGATETCALGYGLRVLSSTSIVTYGAGLYSFFNNYDVSCSNATPASNLGGVPAGNPVTSNGAICQNKIFSIEASSGVNVYNLNTIGSVQMITRDGAKVARAEANLGVYPNGIAIFRV